MNLFFRYSFLEDIQIGTYKMQDSGLYPDFKDVFLLRSISLNPIIASLHNQDLDSIESWTHEFTEVTILNLLSIAQRKIQIQVKFRGKEISVSIPNLISSMVTEVHYEFLKLSPDEVVDSFQSWRSDRR